MADIVPAWKWRNPLEIIESLLLESARTDRRGEAISKHKKRPRIWDRHYRQARRLHVKQLMKGKT